MSGRNQPLCITSAMRSDPYENTSKTDIASECPELREERSSMTSGRFGGSSQDQSLRPGWQRGSTNHTGLSHSNLPDYNREPGAQPRFTCAPYMTNVTIFVRRGFANLIGIKHRVLTLRYRSGSQFRGTKIRLSPSANPSACSDLLQGTVP